MNTKLLCKAGIHSTAISYETDFSSPEEEVEIAENYESTFDPYVFL